MFSPIESCLATKKPRELVNQNTVILSCSKFDHLLILLIGPISFRLGKGEVIRGWDLAASTMQKGERCILTVGPEYGYKASGAGPIPPNATLIFEMEMMDWDEPSADGIKIYQWIGAVVVMCMIYYVLYVDDEEDIARRAQEL